MTMLDEVYELLNDFAQSEGSLHEDIERLAEEGNELWEGAFEFDSLKATLEGGYNGFAEWLDALFIAEPVTENVIAYNFGFFESEDGKQIYISGSDCYDAHDFDWACENTYFPEGRYPELEAFKKISAFTEDYEAGIYLCLSAAMAYISEYCRKRPSFAPQHIATGFDDGDLVNIVPMSQN